MAIDQGTTSSRAIIFNKKAEIIASSQKNFTNFSKIHDAMQYGIYSISYS